MTGCFMVMATLEDGVAKGFVIGDIDLTLIGHNACHNLPVRKVRVKGEGNILVHGLKGWENKGAASRDEFNAMRESDIDDVDVDKEVWGRRVTPLLSVSECGRRLGRCERASGPARSFPGM